MIENFNEPLEEGADFGNMIDRKNYAGQKTIREWVVDNVIRPMDRAKNDRSKKEESLKRYWDVWNHRQTENSRMYEGQSDVYIPMAHKVIETLVEQINENAFPRNSIIETKQVDPLDEAEMRAAKAWRTNLQHDIEEMQFEDENELLVRQALVCGASPVKLEWRTVWHKPYKPTPFLDPQAESITGEQIVLPQQEKQVLYNGPWLRVVDLLRFYMWPTTAKRMFDVKIFAEKMDKSKGWLKREQRAGRAWGVKQLIDGIMSDLDSSNTNRDDRAVRSGFTHDMHEKSKLGIFEMTEYWATVPLPGRPEGVPCQIRAVGHHVLTVRQNPFWHQLPPYFLYTIMGKFDDVYAKGKIEAIEHAQYALNATFNLKLDNLYWRNSPMMAINSARVPAGAQNITIAPQQVLHLDSNPNDVVAWYQPPDSSFSSNQTTNELSGLIQDIPGAPPIVQGKLGSKDLTATQSRILQGGATTSLRHLTRKLNKGVLTPLVKRMHALIQQFRSQEEFSEIARDPEVKLLPPEVVLRDFGIEWRLGTEALEAAQAQQVADQMGVNQDPQAQAQQQMAAQAAAGGMPEQLGVSNLPNTGLGQGI